MKVIDGIFIHMELIKACYSLYIDKKISLLGTFSGGSSNLMLRIINCMLVCRWGPLLEEANQKNRQRIYLSEQVTSLSCLTGDSFISEMSECRSTMPLMFV